jgi:hypothetical protein
MNEQRTSLIHIFTNKSSADKVSHVISIFYLYVTENIYFNCIHEILNQESKDDSVTCTDPANKYK